MGFDLSRFVGKVDQEFQCSICAMILENPLQTPCEHLFCSKCIEEWMANSMLCPVDRRPLTINDLKPINRTIRNLLSKLEIKCAFDSLGCNVIVKLENLQGHVTRCKYNLDAQMVCDKGCKLEISRREYQTSNCFTHMETGYKRENAKLNNKLSNQKKYFEGVVQRQRAKNERLSNELTQLRRQNDQLGGVTYRHEGEIRKLTHELHQLRRRSNHSAVLTQLPRQRITNVNEGTKISLLTPMMGWGVSNMKRPSVQTNILEIDDKCKGGFARSFNALDPINTTFKVKVLDGKNFTLGLSFKGLTGMKFDKWFAKYSGQHGLLDFNGLTKRVGSECKIGDIIEIGIKFPSNFDNAGNAFVELYMSINERVVAGKRIKMPIDPIYPAISIHKCRQIIGYTCY